MGRILIHACIAIPKFPQSFGDNLWRGRFIGKLNRQARADQRWKRESSSRLRNNLDLLYRSISADKRPMISGHDELHIIGAVISENKLRILIIAIFCSISVEIPRPSGGASCRRSGGSKLNFLVDTNLRTGGRLKCSRRRFENFDRFGDTGFTTTIIDDF